MEPIAQLMEQPPQVPEARPGTKWPGIIVLSLSAVLVALILAASWSADSRMTTLRWLPGWAAQWADRDPNFRTAIPFIPLAFLLLRGFAWRGWKSPLLGAALVCGGCLGLSELGQVFLPARTADVADLLWGAAGIASGLFLASALRWKK